MIVDHELGLTILGQCGLRLVVENTRSWEWISLPRREPRRARERLQGLTPWRPKLIEARPSNNSELGQSGLQQIRQTGPEAATF